MGEKNIMVVPLLSGSGMRIKIVEGMAMGKAIVSTSIGAEGIPVQSGRNLMIADTPDSFIQIISDLLLNRDKCIMIGNNAKSFIKENFDNLAIAGSLLEFYEEQLS
jgi:glycosyltransferase involved in cell wall biosynthesis